MAKPKKEPVKAKNPKLSKAMEGNQNAVGNEGGRPSDYQEAFADKAYKLCLLGATDADLADFFEVTEATINNWKHAHPEFFDSISQGKSEADMEVAHSLYKGTRDRVVIEQQAFKVKNIRYNDKGQRIEEEKIEVIELEKVIPGDFRNQQFWLKNRRSDKWRDKTEVDSKNTNFNYNSEPLTPEKIREINSALENDY